jgi:flagellar biosynthesis/type III secretory pathway protein FliH
MAALMIEVFTPDQRLTGDQARQAVQTEDWIAARRVSFAALEQAAHANADEVIAGARQRAIEILETAETDAVAIRAAADGRLDELRGQLQQDMEQQLAQEMAGIATQLTDVVLAALHKVVGDIGADAMAKAAVLHVMRNHPQIAASRLRVPPGSAGALSDLPVEVVPDASLAVGDAVLETAQGLVDLGAGAQMVALRAAFCPPADRFGTRGAA